MNFTEQNSEKSCLSLDQEKKLNHEVKVEISPDFNKENLDELISVLKHESNSVEMVLTVITNNCIYLKLEELKAKESLLEKSPIKWKEFILTIQNNSIVNEKSRDQCEAKLLKEEHEINNATHIEGKKEEGAKDKNQAKGQLSQNKNSRKKKGRGAPVYVEPTVEPYSIRNLPNIFIQK